MNFVYDIETMKIFLKRSIQLHIKPEGWSWLDNEAVSIQKSNDISRFNIAFVAMPRKTGKSIISLPTTMVKELQSIRSGLDFRGWTVDRLSRSYLFMHLDSGTKEKYCSVIENLFLNAEMNEQVALYSALPFFAYPESWKKRCAEGIRSNISQVLESIICNNPYPSEQLDESAWNQLVLKAIFTEKPILKIYGLHTRMNQHLANALSDYAHERWAAHRPVNPLLWICVGPFINEKIFPDIQRALASEDIMERHAAALACAESKYPLVQQLLEQSKEFKSSMQRGEISWESIAFEIEKRGGDGS